MQSHTSDFPPPLPGEPSAVSDTAQEDHYKTLFIGEKYQTYYKEKFDQITPKKLMAGFNIAAFFLGIAWLFYRKMYAYGFVCIGLLFLLGMIEGYFNINENASNIGLAVFFGLMGNTLYKQFVEKQISTAQQSAAGNLEEQVRQKGGTNIWAALAIVTVIILLVGLGYTLEAAGY